jgi:Domain of unknown function (DUF4159)
MRKSKNNKYKKKITGRRQMLGMTASAISGLLLFPDEIFAQRPRYLPGYYKPEVPEMPIFRFAQAAHGDKMSWNPHPTAGRSLVEMLMQRTSIPAFTDKINVSFESEKLFRNPFIYWTGTREFDPLSEKAVERVKLFLEMGGFMLVDDALSAPGIGFDKSFQREMSRIFPGKALKRIPDEHTVYQSYYLIDRVAGRTANRPYLTGLDQDDRTMLLYSGNDMGGAFARDRSGRWLNTVGPGGEIQREMSVRLGINIIMYALCVNYKKDLIHVPFISKRRKGGR